MAEVAARGASVGLCLADGEPGMVVLEHELARVLVPQAGDKLLVGACAERGDDQRLSFAALEEGGAVCPRQQADLADDVAYRVEVPAVGPAALDDLFPQDLALEPFEARGDRRGGDWLSDVGVAELLDERFAYRGQRAAAGRLLWERYLVTQTRICLRPNPLVKVFVDLGLRSEFFRLARLESQLLLHLYDRLEFLVGELDRVRDFGLRHLVRLALEHDDSVGRGRHDDGEIAALDLVVGWADNELAVDAAHSDGADRASERYGRETKGRRRPDDVEDVGVATLAFAFGGKHDARDLDLGAGVGGEQRPQRPVRQPHGENFFEGRAPFALVEASARDPACGEHLLAVFDEKRKEIDIVASFTRHRSDENDRIPVLD